MKKLINFSRGRRNTTISIGRTIINGVNINEKSSNRIGKKKTYNEIKTVPIGNHKYLKIETDFDIEMVPLNNSNVIECVLIGEANISGKLQFEVKKEMDTTYVICKASNYCTSNLKLTVYVPFVKFNNIIINSTCGDVFLKGNILSKYIDISSKSGYISSYSNFEFLTISNCSGNIFVCIKGNVCTKCNIKTMSGDIDISLKDVSSTNITSETMSGSVRNFYINSSKGCHTDIIAISMSGDILIH